MNINELAKEKDNCLEKLNAYLDILDKENRALNSEELADAQALKQKIGEYEAQIRLLENRLNFKKVEKSEIPTLADTIKNLTSDEVLTNLDFEKREVGLSLNPATTNTTTTKFKDTAKIDFAEQIIERLVWTSGLFSKIKRVPLNNGEKAINLIKSGLNKALPVRELESYVRNAMSIAQIKLNPNKLGTVIGMSLELLEDYGYNIEQVVLDELTKTFAITLDEVIVTGLIIDDQQIDGLETFTEDDGTIFTELTTLEIDDIISMYHKLPQVYIKNATWIISREVAEVLTKMKDATGNPILVPSYNSAPFGSSHTMLGKPVIINEYVQDLTTAGNKAIYFGDLEQALVCGIRKALEIRKSTEYGFVNDEILLKAQ